MGGPIVRTGTNPKFWQGWDKVFGDKDAKSTKSAKKTAKPQAAAKKAPAKKSKKSK